MSTGSIVGFAGIGRTLFLLLLLMLGLMALGSPLDAQTPNTFNVNSTADILSPANGTVTLRSAIQAANLSSAGNGNIINLTVPGTYKITAGALAILPSAGNLTIMNASGGTVIVDGNHIDRVFRINPAIAPTAFNVTMNGFTITNGSAQNSANPDGADASGGGIRADGPVSLTLTNMTLTNNQATADGGGISMENAKSAAWSLTLNNTIVSGNRAGDIGGGIDADGAGKVSLNAGTLVSNNTAVNFGGGIGLDAIQAGNIFQTANLTLENTVVTDNLVLSSTSAGGGIFNAGNGTVTISASTIENNNSAGSGGGYGDLNAQGSLSVTGSSFLNNVAAGNGGGIAAAGPNLTIAQSEIDGNTSNAHGGGVYATSLVVTVSQSTFADNTAGQVGGGLELGFAEVGTLPTISIVNSTLTGNSIVSATDIGRGGGIYFGPTGGPITFENNTISGNAAPTAGGGISWGGPASLFTVQNTIVAGNTAPNSPDALGTFTDSGGNLIGVIDGSGGFSSSTTQTGTAASPLDPLLGSLENNGGPTLTKALVSGSPAIDKGVTNALTVDQRSVLRPQGSAYDVGAYEFNAGPTPTAKLSALNLDFGDLGVGASASQTITLTNTGTGDLHLSAVGFLGADPADFAIMPAAGCAAPATLAASQACRYTATFTPPIAGPRTASLSFTDDTVNVPGSTQTVAIVGNGITLTGTNTSLALTSGTSPSAMGASLTFTATVTPSTATGLVNFFDGTTSIGAVPLSGGSAALTTSSFAPGNHSITAQYLGDTFDSQSTSSALEQQVAAPTAADFTISANPSTATVTAGGSATFAFTLTPQNGFSQTISFLCAGLPSGATCVFAPASITPGSAAATSTLTISTTAATTSGLREPGTEAGGLNASLSSSGVLVGSLWVMVGRRRRAGNSRLLPLGLVVVLVAAAGTTVSLTGCGGNTNTVTKTLTPGTPAGTSQVTVLASGGASSHTVAVTLTVH